MPYLFAWKTICAFASLSHQPVQLPTARKRFAGDSAVLLERQEFTNRGGQTKVTETEGPGTLPNEAGGDAASTIWGPLAD